MPNLELNAKTPSEELPTDSRSLDTVAQSAVDLFLAPIVADRVQRLTSRFDTVDARMLDDVLDDETELVENDLRVSFMGSASTAHEILAGET